MIGSKSKRCLRFAHAYVALGMCADALDVIAKLEPEEQASAPVMALRMSALTVGRRWGEAVEIALMVADLMNLDPGRVGPVARLLYFELAGYVAREGEIDYGRACIDASTALAVAPSCERLTDPRDSALWDFLQASFCPHIEPSTWPDHAPESVA